MEPKRHVSRWHAAATVSALATTAAAAASPPDASQPEVSLRYLNEFVGKLQCASALLDHKLYPDAKEITESMGVFNAVRKYMLVDEREAAAIADAPTRAKADGIVVVGDGSTPRTAAMFAHRLRHWKSYSIDPAMEYRSSERSLGWETIANLVVIRNKIEKVRITLRRAIIVLVHAHVTLEQALSAVDAEEVVGVVTLPCCNWFSKQESLFGRQPDLVYDDFSILSDKREMRLWVGGKRNQSTAVTAADEEIVISEAEVKVCIRKTFRAGTGNGDEAGELAAVAPVARDLSAKAAAEAKYTKVFGIFKDLLSMQTHAGEDSQQLRLPVELKPRLASDMHTLVLNSRDAKAVAVASSLLREGHQHVYVLGEPREELSEHVGVRGSDENGGSFQQEAMTIPLLKLSLLAVVNGDELMPEPAISDELQGSFCIATKELSVEDEANEEDDPTSGFIVTFEASSSSFAHLDCVVDNRFLYHGFRGESRNAALFRKLCALVHTVAATARSDARQHSSVSLICVTPRKNWRKKDYLSHEALQFEVQSVPVKQQLPVSWELKDRSKRDQELTFIYCCTKIHRGDADRVHDKRELASQQSMKDAVLAMKQTLQLDFDAALLKTSSSAVAARAVQELSVQQVVELAPSAADIDPSVVADRTYVQVLGQISNVRRYTKGMAFLSLEPPTGVLPGADAERSSDGDSAASFNPRVPLQAFLQLQELQWSAELFKDVLLMLHAGDQVRVLGFLKKSERGTPLLSVAAIAFVRGEFQAYA